MNVSTALNHQNRFDRLCDEVYVWARRLGWTHEEIMDRLEEIYSDPAWSRCPSRVREHIRARNRLRFDQLYMVVEHPEALRRVLARGETPACLVWRLRVKGSEAMYDSWDDLVASCGERPSDDQIEGAHVWSHTGTAFAEWR